MVASSAGRVGGTPDIDGRLRRLSAAHERSALVRRRPASFGRDGQLDLRRLHASSTTRWKDATWSGRRPWRISSSTQSSFTTRSNANDAIAAGGRSEPLTLYEPFDYVSAEAQMGHGDRSDGVHRLQRLRRRLPGGEQHSRRRQGAGRRAAARCTGCASIATSAARPNMPDGVPFSAAAVHALRKRAVRIRLSGRGHGA